jgi:TIR domain
LANSVHSQKETTMPPLIFISHKQSDKAIAEAVAKFLKDEATREIRIFLSSSTGFEGVRFGKPISTELRGVLANADVFLLLYTSPDEDWSWCMWEWGIANHPASAKTTMVVLQCGTESPKIDVGNRRVNVRQKDEIHTFVKQYFTIAGFFPSLEGEAFGGHFSSDTIAAKAEKFFDTLMTFPAIDPTMEWQTWPFLQLELPITLVDRIKDLVRPLSRAEQLSLIRQETKVTVANTNALAIFGLAGLAADTPFSNLALHWKNAFDGREADWFEACCDQVLVAAAERLPSTRPSAVRAVHAAKDYMPLITKVRRSSYQGTVRFDLYFIDRLTFEAEAVTGRMLTLDQFYWRPVSDQMLSDTRLIELSQELKSQGKNRLPLLDQERRIKYVIHRGSIDEFIIANLSRANQLSLRDLLNDPTMHAIVTQTWVVVGRHATIDEVRSLTRGDVRDIFITATGSKEEPLEGWLTNVDLAQVAGR